MQVSGRLSTAAVSTVMMESSTKLSNKKNHGKKAVKESAKKRKQAELNNTRSRNLTVVSNSVIPCDSKKEEATSDVAIMAKTTAPFAITEPGSKDSKEKESSDSTSTIDAKHRSGNLKDQASGTTVTVKPLELCPSMSFALKQLLTHPGQDFTLSEVCSIIHVIFDSILSFQIRKIAQATSVMPCTSVECERAFSAMNLVKGRLRNRMKTDTLNKLVLVHMHGPNISHFPFKDVVSIWQKLKTRRIRSGAGPSPH